MRQKLAAYNAAVECLNFKFEETPEGKFVETVIAAQGELERHQIRRQTIQKMKARVEQGFYVFKVPVGYRYEKSKGQGKVLMKDERLASIVQEALMSYASGRFQLQVEVKRFLEQHTDFPRDGKGEVRNQQVTDILTRPVYAGLVEAPAWGVTLRQGRHEPLISVETYQRIQDRLAGALKAPARKDLDVDFPLRGAVVCGCCETPLTACWSAGRSGRYAYYLCFDRGCSEYRKSVRREVIEGEFAALLKRLEPSDGLFSAARAMLKDIWEHRLASGQTRAAVVKTELKKLERQIEQFLDRIAEAEVPSVVTAYERRIRKLEEQKLILGEKLAGCGRPVRSFDETVRTALEFLANPWKLWSSERLEDKRSVLKLTFASRLAYTRNRGFRTADLSLPFKILGSFSSAKIEMASPRGFDQWTLAVVAKFSR